MKNWIDLPYFLALANTGSIAKTAKKLGVNRTTVSRRIETFEAKIGTKLFEKRTTGYVTTSIGQQILRIAENAEEQFTTLERQILGQDRKLEGRLRVSASIHIVSDLLTQPLVDFSKKFPNILIDLSITNDFLDLGNLEAEVVIRITKSPPMTLVGRGITSFATALYGSVNDGHSANKDLQTQHSGKFIGVSANRKISEDVKKYLPNLTLVANVNDLIITRELIAAGLGSGVLPCYIGDQDKRLIRKSPPIFSTYGWKIWILTHPDIKDVERVKVFTNFMSQSIQQQASLILGKKST